jgi:hypothetical protein
MFHKLEVSVHSHWNENPPVYRLYVDDEMLTERTFSWTSYQFYLIEHIGCYLDTGVHTLKLENLDTDASFELDDFKVNNNPVNKNFLKSNTSDIEWKFIVDLVNDNSHSNHITLKLDDVSRSITPPIQHTQQEAQIKQKKYETNLALVQRMRELNNRATKK